MSLLNKASLIQIPSGYKDGTLYSAKPTNGDGDFTFSRGSNLAATRVNSEGLIEKGRENLLTYSNDFSNAAWTKYGGVTLTSGQADKDGGTDAWLLTKPAASFTGIGEAQTITGVITFSVFAKANTHSKVTIRLIGTPDVNVVFNLSDGTIFGGTSLGWIDRKIESVGNGWYKCSLTLNNSGSTNAVIYPDEITNTTAGSVLIQDAQLEVGLVSTDVITTTTTTAQAGILEDMPRLDYSGGATCPSLLLEPQRSNLIPYSENFLVTGVTYTGASGAANEAISPEGLQNAYKITEDSTNARHRFYLTNASSVSSGNVVISAFLKDGNRGYGYLHLDTVTDGRYSIIIDLSNGQVVDTMTFGTPTLIDYKVEDYGNGWYRAFVVLNKTTSGVVYPQLGLASSDSDTNDSGAPSYQGDGTHYIYCYGLQLEEGSYPTSYIPTYGASVTRSDEYFNTSVDLQTEGILSSTWTFLYDQTFVDVPRDNAAAVFLIEDSSGNSVRISLSVDGSFRCQISRVGILATTSGNKILGRYDGSSVEFFVDGVSVGSGSALPNEFDNLNQYNPSTETSKTIKLNQILIFPTALTDAECIQLTT